MMTKKVKFISVLVLASLYPCLGTTTQGEALYDIKTKLQDFGNQLDSWKRNQVSPCIWSHVKCDDQNINIVEVDLSSMGFNGTLSHRIGELAYLEVFSLSGNNVTGGIPAEIGNLTRLQILRLDNNHLNGELPESLGNLSELYTMDLSGNFLSGNIPDSLSKLSSLLFINLAFNNLRGAIPNWLFQVAVYNFTGNNLHCGTELLNHCVSNITNQGGSHHPKIAVTLGSVGGVIGLVILSSLLFLLRRKKCDQHDSFVDVAGEADKKIELGQLKRFSWRQLEIATDGFNEKNVLGQGGFGKVFKGVLPDNTAVAIKRLIDNGNCAGEEAFVREVELISFAVHKNLLRLIGFCTTPTERLLVYPYMPNLSVASCLRGLKADEQVLLDWPTRKKIAMGTAHGLEYLHEHCNPKIIHRDVKAANVLLDENFEAVIGDFGLAKLMDVKKTSVTTCVRGTMGHIAPEYLSTGKSSSKTDVYGYGIMLLELVTGQRAIDMSLLDGDVLLLDKVKKLSREKRLDMIIDSNLNKEYDVQEVEKIVQIALVCTQPSPETRPNMSEVICMLEGEGLAERWEELQKVEVNQKWEYERLQRRLNWDDCSSFALEPVELSGGR